MFLQLTLILNTRIVGHSGQSMINLLMGVKNYVQYTYIHTHTDTHIHTYFQNVINEYEIMFVPIFTIVLYPNLYMFFYRMHLYICNT